DLRVDVGVDETVQSRHAFKHAGHILRRNSCNEDFRRGWTSLWRFARTTSNQQHTNHQSAAHSEPFHEFVIAVCGEVSSADLVVIGAAFFLFARIRASCSLISSTSRTVTIWVMSRPKNRS